MIKGTRMGTQKEVLGEFFESLGKLSFEGGIMVAFTIQKFKNCMVHFLSTVL